MVLWNWLPGATFCFMDCYMRGSPIELLWSLFQLIKTRQFLLLAQLERLALASSGEGCAVAGLGEGISKK